MITLLKHMSMKQNIFIKNKMNDAFILFNFA